MSTDGGCLSTEGQRDEGQRHRHGSNAPYGSRLLGSADQALPALRVRLQTLTTATIVAANLVGVGAVVALNGWVLPGGGALSSAMFAANAIAIPIYVVVALVVGVGWGTRTALRRVDWLLDERIPDRHEQRAALQTPVALVRVQAVLWAAGVVVFTTLSVVVQPSLAVNVAITATLGGVVTCMAAYLLTEFVMRPVAARALSADPGDQLLVPGVTARSLLAWGLGSAVPVGGLMLVALLALVRDDVTVERLSVSVLALGGTMLVIGALLTTLAVRATVDPIRSLREAIHQVERGELDTEVVVYDGSELGLLQAAFNRMVSGLRERDRIRDLFGRHVGEAVARDALEREVELGGELRDVSVLFVDVIGSTKLTAERPPKEVVDLLNRFFSVVVGIVDEHGGTVNKFEGDGALAVFGAPAELQDHEGAALRAGRALRDRLAREVPECPAGIGIATGSVVAGNVGQERRFEYTVIGDPVNEAARLCDAAKTTEARVLASRRTLDRTSSDERSSWRSGDSLILRGRPTPTDTVAPQPTGRTHDE
ncbi:MAG: adenylate/guanylate cyclase domain-containing protein [Thermoleophilaceae bacterium]